jgi:hypothetical protein
LYDENFKGIGAFYSEFDLVRFLWFKFAFSSELIPFFQKILCIPMGFLSFEIGVEDDLNLMV